MKPIAPRHRLQVAATSLWLLTGMLRKSQVPPLRRTSRGGRPGGEPLRPDSNEGRGARSALGDCGLGASPPMGMGSCEDVVATAPLPGLLDGHTGSGRSPGPRRGVPSAPARSGRAPAAGRIGQTRPGRRSALRQPVAAPGPRTRRRRVGARRALSGAWPRA